MTTRFRRARSRLLLSLLLAMCCWLGIATESAAQRTPPLPVVQGGSGNSTLTPHGVTIGEGTSPVAITSAGTAGQPLLSGGASADPNWGLLGLAGGGTGTATPSLTAGTGIAISGTWPGQTITNTSNISYNVKAIAGGTVGTGEVSYGASMATGSTSLVLASATNINGFVSGDVNKSVLVSGTNTSGDITDLYGTVSAFTDSTHVTISLAAPTGGLTSCNVYWWTTGQDDGAAIQAGLNSAARVYMPAGVYVVTGASTPLLYAPTLQEWFGDGPRRTIILSSTNNLGGRMVHFTDANYLWIHDFSTRGSGINGVFGGQWTFDLSASSNIERVEMDRIEVDQTASTDAIYFNTPILCTLNQVKSLYNVGNGIHLYNGVSDTLNNVYAITEVSSGIEIENSTDIAIIGSAAESSGMGVYLKNSKNVHVISTDAEAQVHRTPDAPASFPAVTVAAGGTVAVGTYYLKYTWERQYTGASVSFESLPSPESSPVTTTNGNQTINFTLPIAPTDAPNVKYAEIYMTQANGAAGSEVAVLSVTLTNGGASTTAVSFSAPPTFGSATPPYVAGVGHGFVVDGGSRNSIVDSHSRSIGSTTSRHLLAVGSTAQLDATNFDVVEGGTIPAYDIELQSGSSSINLSTGIASSKILNNATEVSMRTSDLRNIQSPGPITVAAGGANNVTLQSGTSNYTLLNPSGGNVGIGTPTPLGTVQIVVPSSSGATGTWGSGQMVVGASGNTGGVGVSYNQTTNTGFLEVVSPGVANRNLVLNLNGGNVGIGTTNPALQLQATKAIGAGVNTVTFSATPTFDASLGNTQTITLTGNVTSSTLSNCAAGEWLVFDIIQDATGSRTFVWPTNVQNPGTIGATASKHNVQQFYCDGTNARAIAAMLTNQN